MNRIDVKRDERDLYHARRDRITLVDVPLQRFIMLDGRGSPSTPEFEDAVRAIHDVADEVHARTADRTYAATPLEALWWWDDEAPEREHEWRWTLMLRLPEPISEPEFRAALAVVQGHDAALPRRVRIGALREGRCAQLLHVGPYARELSALQALHGQIQRAGLKLNGKHHEIYLGDPRRARPENLRTILRQPVA